LVRSTTLTATDVDHARTIAGRYFYSSFIDVLTPSAPLEARFDITTGDGLTLGDVWFGADIRMRCGELGAYHVDVLISGELAWRQGSGDPLMADQARAAVFRPDRETTLDRWSGDCRLLALKIDRQALEGELARLLDAPVQSPVRLAPELDVRQGPGATWMRLLRTVAADAAQPGGLLRHPVLSRSLRENLITGLLYASDHQYRERMDAAEAVLAAPRAVRRVVEAMRADPGRPFTVGDLAEIAGVSRRSLQDSFQRYVGVPPMTYLRHVRLERVHAELHDADPTELGVADVAYRYGFVHLGRFASAYRARYGVAPSHTLRH
jgi:AraC-like DNA-binding protein